MSALRNPRRKIIENPIQQVDALVLDDSKKPTRVTSIRFPDRLMLKMKLVADYKGQHYQEYIRDVLEREVDHNLQERFSKNITAVH